MNRLSGILLAGKEQLWRLACLLRRGILSGTRFGCVGLILLAGCVAAVPGGETGQQDDRLPTDAEVEQYNAQVAPEDRIVCREETSVASNIPRRRCRYVRDIEKTSRITREQLRNMLR